MNTALQMLMPRTSSLQTRTRGGSKQYFLKYHPGSNQRAVVVIDSYSKVIVDAECRTLVNVTQQELQSFEKQNVYDE